MADVSEKHENLWLVVASPTIWALHFVLAYSTAAIWCAKAGLDASLGVARIAIAILSVVALAAVTWIGVRGYRRHRLGGATAPHADDTPEDRYRFIGFTTALLSGLSALAIIYETLVIVFIGSCR